MLIPEGFAGWWKKYSAVALAAIVAIQGAWMLSTDLQALMPKSWLDAATLVLAVLGFVGRFIKQSQSAIEDDPT